MPPTSQLSGIPFELQSLSLPAAISSASHWPLPLQSSPNELPPRSTTGPTTLVGVFMHSRVLSSSKESAPAMRESAASAAVLDSMVQPKTGRLSPDDASQASAPPRPIAELVRNWLFCTVIEVSGPVGALTMSMAPPLRPA